MDLSIVVPCCNEGDVLDDLTDRLSAVLPKISSDYEVILVDDGSSDETLAKARRASVEHPGFRFVSLSRNFGKEAALVAGLSHATASRIAVLDADLQHPPEMLPDMVKLLDSGYDQVVARRTRHGESFARTALSRLYYWAVNKLVDVSLQDGVGDFRLLSRRAVDALLSLPEHNRFSKGLCSWIGFDTATVSYRNVVRGGGKSKWSAGKLLNYGIDGILSFNNKPLRAAIHLGALITVLAFCYATFVVVNTLVYGVRVPGYATLVVAVACLGGINLLVLGVIGEYLGRIYVETKRRPPFLVKETGPVDKAAASAPWISDRDAPQQRDGPQTAVNVNGHDPAKWASRGR
ncbi:glycosyltransferase family 2 protein [Saccharopolyspora hattusasensis]|uniref:glycosyltransferase family 2 protein n=1 Tax=Saccharopolyspora hattusasensis TaxID=1128679 RepID=UPI003D9A0168